MDGFFAGALFWLPRVAIVLLILAAAIWGADKGLSWFKPPDGDSAPAFEAGTADQNALFARLLQAEFIQIKADLTAGTQTVERLVDSWTKEFENIRKKKETDDQRRASLKPVASADSQAQVIASDVKPPLDLSRVSMVVGNLKLISNEINPAKVPDIKIASVEFGPVLRWLVDVFRSPSENKVAIFDENSGALIEGPIISSGRTVLEFEPITGKRTMRQTVEAVAYQILTSKLSSSTPAIDFGSGGALRDFVVGTKTIAKLVAEPPDEGDRPAWNKQISDAAHLIEKSGASARNWKIVALASFLFERSVDFDNAIRVLDRYAEFTAGKDPEEKDRKARLDYLRDRRVETAVASALDSRKGDGTVFAATAEALARLPSATSARKLHRLDGRDRGKIKVAIVSGAKPHWFGLDGPPDAVPVEEYLDLYGAGLAQIVRILSPSVDISFVPLNQNDSGMGAMTTSELLIALNTVASTDIPIILLPFGPLQGDALDTALGELMKQGHLVIIPAGNDGGPGTVSVKNALVAESVELDGKRSKFSSIVTGSLGAVGELPIVELTEAGPTVKIGLGTSNAAAALAAIAAETIARQPALKGTALRDALVKAATVPTDPDRGPPVARVAIPR